MAARQGPGNRGPAQPRRGRDDPRIRHISDLDFTLLGELGVRRSGEAVEVRGPRVRAMLALLLLRANQSTSDDELALDLWIEAPPASPRRAVQLVALRLRRALGPDADRLNRTASGYSLRVEPGEIDLERARRLVDEGEAALGSQRLTEAAVALETALSLWRAVPLTEFAELPAVAEATRAIDDLRWRAVGMRNRALLDNGGGAEIVPQLSASAREAPLSEPIQRDLMLALYRAGRQTEALEVFRALRTHLIDELGVLPSAATIALHQEILEQAPGLLGARPRDPASLDERVAALRVAEQQLETAVRQVLGDLDAHTVGLLARAARTADSFTPADLAATNGHSADPRSWSVAVIDAGIVREGRGGTLAFVDPRVRALVTRLTARKPV